MKRGRQWPASPRKLVVFNSDPATRLYEAGMLSPAVTLPRLPPAQRSRTLGRPICARIEPCRL